MNNNEILSKIQKGVNVGQRTKNILPFQDIWNDNTQKAAECERKIRSTGIVEIFEGIKEKGIVKLNNTTTNVGSEKVLSGAITIRRDLKYTPAIVEISKDMPEVSLKFNEKREGWVVTRSCVSAYLDDRGILFIKGGKIFEVGKIAVDEAIIKAINNPFFETGNDCS